MRTIPAMDCPLIMFMSMIAWYVPGKRTVSAMAKPVWNTGSVWWVLGLNSNSSSQVMKVLGITTMVPEGMRITWLLTSIQPPVLLQLSGLGGLSGVGAGLSSLLHSPGVASSDAYSICPAIQPPAGRLWYAGS